MNNQVFVPVTDDIIYNHPECIQGPLVPYAAGMECHEWLSIEINPDEPETETTEPTSIGFGKGKKNLRLAYSS